MSEIISYLSFSDWLISLSMMFSRSIHAVAKDKIFFFFYGPVVFCCVNVLQLFCPLIYCGHLGCSHILAIIRLSFGMTERRLGNYTQGHRVGFCVQMAGSDPKPANFHLCVKVIVVKEFPNKQYPPSG